tara:strand:- start:3949 stop:5127 length:1179 start_codon:yes stop_codon:yes gene_type:complete
MANTLNLGNGNWATKEDSLLAYNAENGNFKPLPFDFTRASSATVVNKAGLIETVGSGEPRIDFNNDAKGALLLEPTRSNLLSYSNDFSNADWINNGVTINANQVVSPNGALNADLLTGVSGGFGVVKFSTWTATNKVASCFAKKGSTDLFQISNKSSSNRYVIFDLSNGIVSEESTGWTGSIENFGNGWYRCTAISNSETGTFSLGVTAASESVYIWGSQLEQGSYPTSYIPTYGSVVTRVDDNIALTLPNSNSFNSSNGFTIFGEFISNGGSGASNSFIQADGNVGYLGFGSTGSVFRARANDGTSNELFNSSSSIFTDSKLALSVDSNGFSMYADGVSFANGNRDFSGINSLDNVIFRDGTEEFGSLRISDFRIYNTRLTNSELQALTAI